VWCLISAVLVTSLLAIQAHQASDPSSLQKLDYPIFWPNQQSRNSSKSQRNALKRAFSWESRTFGSNFLGPGTALLCVACTLTAWQAPISGPCVVQRRHSIIFSRTIIPDAEENTETGIGLALWTVCQLICISYRKKMLSANGISFHCPGDPTCSLIFAKQRSIHLIIFRHGESTPPPIWT